MTVLDNNAILNSFVKENSVDMCLLLDNTSKVIGNVAVNYAESVATLSNGILSMVEKFSQDMTFGQLKQLQIKTTDGLIFFQKVTKTSTLVIFTKESINQLIFLKNLEQITIQLNK